MSDLSVQYCYVTTTGRRTGAPHRIEIWFASDGLGRTLYVLSGNGERADWVRNLRRHPGCTVEVDGITHAAVARILEPGDPEDSRARGLVFAKYEESYDGDLTGWRDSSLVVALDLGEPVAG